MSRKTYFVDVIIPLAVPNLYTYRVPNDMNEDIAIGKRVVVQFGRGKLYSGLVRVIHENPPKKYVAKYIDSILDDHPIVNSKQFEFWDWMSSYYMCTIGEVMVAALPGGLRLASETKIVLNPEYNNANENKEDNPAAAISDKEYIIIDALEIQNVLSIQEVSKILDQKTVYPIIKGLIEKGVVFIHEELKEKFKAKIETFLQITEHADDEENLKSIFDKLERKAPKQLDVLMAYIQLSERYSKAIGDQKKEGRHGVDLYKEVKKSDILKRIEGAEAAIKSMEKKNIFRLYQREVGRFAQHDNVNFVSQLNEIQQQEFESIQEQFGWEVEVGSTKLEVRSIKGEVRRQKTEDESTKYKLGSTDIEGEKEGKRQEKEEGSKKIEEGSNSHSELDSESARGEKEIRSQKLEVKSIFKPKDVVLLHGVTSSGKTEIYVKLIEKVLAEGKQALYLLPEIALTTQIISRLRKYFGDQVGVYHSKFNGNERVEVWNSVIQSAKDEGRSGKYEMGGTKWEEEKEGRSQEEEVQSLKLKGEERIQKKEDSRQEKERGSNSHSELDSESAGGNQEVQSSKLDSSKLKEEQEERIQKTEGGNAKAENTETSNFELSNFKLIIGARSALFLPFSNLGLVIVDEEHDTSYKQYAPSPRYNARDGAIYLAHLHKAKTLLGSATPSLESFYNAQEGKYGFSEIKQRFGGIQMPEIQIADVKEAMQKKQMKSHFSPLLLDTITLALEKKEQIILFQNRRGFAPQLECNMCAWIPQCNNCDVSLTYHKASNQLRCHYCGYSIKPPSKCAACGDTNLKMKGFGTEKIEEELAIFYPAANIARMDLDTTRSKFAHQHIIQDFEDRKIDILVGTQMVTKGLDFDNVSIVGILNADSMLNFPDFRSFERSFQLMAQVSGRAGRKNKRGTVIIQTQNPDHTIIQDVIHTNFLSMYTHQLADRKTFHYPPFFRLIEISVIHRDVDLVNAASKFLADELKHHFKKRVLGPEFPLVSRIRNQYHKNILLKIEREASVVQVKKILNALTVQFQTNPDFKGVKLQVNVDPM